MRVNKVLLILLSVFLCSASFAATVAEKCDVYVTNTDPHPILLTATTPTVYVFENTSNQSLWLNRAPLRDPGASAGWASQIAPGHYSAFTLAQDCFPMTCSVMDSHGHVSYFNCHNMLHIYAYPMGNRAGTGGYWLVENKTMEAVKQALQQMQPS